MEINLRKKAQVRLIIALATIVLLSTLILAAVAINESNQTDETAKNTTDPNITAIDSSEPVIELTPSETSQETSTEEESQEVNIQAGITALYKPETYVAG